jgi:hypothetical protein
MTAARDEERDLLLTILPMAERIVMAADPTVRSRAREARVRLLALAGLEQTRIMPPSRAYRALGFSPSSRLTRARLDRDGVSSAMVVQMLTALAEVPPLAQHLSRAWTAEEDAALLGYADASWTNARICLAMGVTRRTVDQRCSVLGIKLKSQRGVKDLAAFDELADIELAAVADADVSGAKPWLERAAGECAWPVSGDGWKVRSCCAPITRRGSSYCDAHWVVAHEGAEGPSGDVGGAPAKPPAPRVSPLYAAAA